MEVSGLSTVMGLSESSGSETNALDKDAFLKLLVTQLQNQDPLNPLDSTEFTAQLAQFSSLEQLGNINDGVIGVQLIETASNNSQAVNLIGKTVKAYGNSIHLTDGVSDNIQLELGADAEAVYVNIYDSDSNLIKTIESGALSAGEQTLEWDGTDKDGNKVADGAYTFEVSAVDADDNKVDATAFISGTVTSVTFIDTIPCLLAGNKEIPIANVIEVTEPEE